MPQDGEPPRLAFRREDLERITAVLATFLKNAHARAVLLVDRDGHALTREGDLSSGEMDALSALAAEAFVPNASGRRTSALFRFDRDHVQLSPVGKRTVLAVVYGDDGSLGMIRLYAAEVALKLTELFDGVERRGDPGDGAGAPVRA
jgi:predicted regulator of Ras-like GTPase activity (Roadblock/LC7/MglB family)